MNSDTATALTARRVPLRLPFYQPWTCREANGCVMMLRDENANHSTFRNLDCKMAGVTEALRSC